MDVTVYIIIMNYICLYSPKYSRVSDCSQEHPVKFHFIFYNPGQEQSHHACVGKR